MTSLLLLIYIVVVIVIAVGSFRKVKTFSDFFVAGKKGSYLSVTGSLIATILGGSAIIGAIDSGSSLGWAASWYMLSASIGLLFLLPISKKVSRLGKFSLPELLGDLYGSSTKNTASVIIPIAWIGIIAAQLIASARILESFTSLTYQQGVIISAIVFVTYTIAGGQISILKTDFIQSVFILIGLIVLAIFAWKYTDNFNSVNAKPFPFNENFKPFDLFILIITYSTTFTAGPDIYSRLFCAKDVNTARKSVLTTAIILIPIAIIIGWLSAFSTLLPTYTGATIVEITKTVLPNWAVPLLVIALLSAVLSSADTTILSTSVILTDFFQKSTYNKFTLPISRTIILITGIISLVISLKFTSIIGVLMIALTIYSGAFIMPVVIGLGGVSVKSVFVKAAIISGGVIAFIGKLFAYFGETKLGNYVIVLAFVINGILLMSGRRQNHKI